MQFDDTLLQRLEKLSMLKIDDAHREEVIGQLGEILGFVDNLAELDTASVDATFAMTANSTSLREDRAASDPQINASILENAPESDAPFFTVPKIIE